MEEIRSTAAGHNEEQLLSLTWQQSCIGKLPSSLNGNFEKAQSLATGAAEAETVANRHAMQGLDLYRHHAEEVAEHKSEVASEVAAREAKHAAKLAAE